MTDQNVISSLAQLGALRLHITQLARDANCLVDKLANVETQFTQILANQNVVSQANKTPQQRQAQLIDGRVVVSQSPAIVQQQPQLVQQTKEKKPPKVYPGYPKACQYCKVYTLKTPRSRSGHERKCPNKPRVEQKPEQENVEQKDQKALQDFHEYVKEVQFRSPARKEDPVESPIANDRLKRLQSIFDDEAASAADYYEAELEDEGEAGSLDDFVVPDDEEEEQSKEDDSLSEEDRIVYRSNKKRRSIGETKSHENNVTDDEDSLEGTQNIKKRRRLKKKSESETVETNATVQD